MQGLNKTALIYARVSSQEQVSNFSIETQLKECQDFLHKNNLVEVGRYIEQGESAKTSQRTELQKLLKHIAKENISTVVVYKLDRWSRNQVDFFALKSYLSKYNCNLVSVTEQITDDPTGRFLEGIFSSLAQLDNELKGKRVKDCMRTKAMDGWYPHMPPVGYTNNPKTRQIDVCSTHGEVIQETFKQFLDGKEIPEIVDYLKLMGYKTKKQLDYTTKYVWKILTKSEFYSGYYTWGDETLIQGKHKPFISFTEHLKIQDKLYSKTTPHKYKEDKFFLNFIVQDNKPFLTCSCCNTRIKSCKSKNKVGNYYYYYYCPNGECSTSPKSIQTKELETQVQNLLQNIQPKQKYIKLFKALVVDEWEQQHKTLLDYQSQVTDKLDKLYKDKRETIKMKRSGELDSEEFKEEMLEIKTQILALESEKNEDGVDLSKLETLLNQADTFLSNVEHLYNGCSIRHKQDLLELIFPNGIEVENGTCRTPQIADVFTLLDRLEDGNSPMVTLRVQTSNTIYLWLVKVDRFIGELFSKSRSNVDHNLALGL